MNRKYVVQAYISAMQNKRKDKPILLGWLAYVLCLKNLAALW